MRLIVFAIASYVVAASSGVTGSEAGRQQKVRTDFGYVVVAEEDITVAIREGEATQAAAKEILLLDGVRFAIVEEGNGSLWGDVDASGLITYTWSFPHGARRFKSRSAVNVLRHEIAHDLFARYMVRTTHFAQYGTDAPDWLDEMAAIAFESDGQFALRRRDAERYGLLPLSRLLQMDHPERTTKVIIEDNRSFANGPASSVETAPYYATISLFYKFLTHETGERSIVAELANDFNAGKELDKSLLVRLEYGDNAEALTEMDQNFMAWFAGGSH